MWINSSSIVGASGGRTTRYRRTKRHTWYAYFEETYLCPQCRYATASRRGKRQISGGGNCMQPQDLYTLSIYLSPSASRIPRLNHEHKRRCCKPSQQNFSNKHNKFENDCTNSLYSKLKFCIHVIPSSQRRLKTKACGWQCTDAICWYRNEHSIVGIAVLLQAYIVSQC